MGPKASVLYGLAAATLLNGVGCNTPQTCPPCQAKAAGPPPSGQITQASYSEAAPGNAEPPRPPGLRALPPSPPARAPRPTVIQAVEKSAGPPPAVGPQTGATPKLLPPPRERMPDTVMAQATSTELTLAEAVQLTSDANPDLQSALERTRIAEAILDNARAQFYPILASNTEYQVSDNPLRKFTYLLSQGVADPQSLFPLPAVENYFHTQIRFQQDLYTGGLRLARTRAAEADHGAALQSLAAVRNRLVFQVAEAYYRVFQARALVGVRRETVAQVESQLKVVQSRFAANTVVKSDVLKVEVRLAEVREALNTTTNSLELATAVLENVMGVRLYGRPLPDQLPPAPWSEHITQVEPAVAAVYEASVERPGEVEAAVTEALERRPEMGEVANQGMAAEHRVRAAQAGKYPTLGFVGDYDVYAGDRSSTDSYFFGLVLSLNLFDGHRTKTSVRQAEAQVREINARHQRLKLDIELDVRRASLQLKDARERLKSTATTLTSAEENLRQVESRFREETTTTTELLDAQVLLSDVRVRSTSAAADVEIARAALERAIGRLTTLLNSCSGTHP